MGNKYILWEKIMEEVKEKCYAGPFTEVPFENFIQSPVGLVPKKGNKIRLIFHLSYCFLENTEDGSVNSSSPKEWCTVHYNDLDTVVKQCLLTSKEAYINFDTKTIYVGKTNLSSTFRVLPLRVLSYCWVVLKADDPRDGRMKYFVDKCLPFGASISCSHYQRFSNSLKHITTYKTGHKTITNFLDDFLFVVMLKYICNQVINGFLEICRTLRILVAPEKTEWGCTCLVFLGFLLDSERLILAIPLDKQAKAVSLLTDMVNKKKSHN